MHESINTVADDSGVRECGCQRNGRRHWACGGKLRPCPGSPNCVRSEMPDRDVQPLAVSSRGSGRA